MGDVNGWWIIIGLFVVAMLIEAWFDGRGDDN